MFEVGSINVMKSFMTVHIYEHTQKSHTHTRTRLMKPITKTETNSTCELKNAAMINTLEQRFLVIKQVILEKINESS